MIKSVEFINFRNLNQKYDFNSSFNVVTGVNNSGKTNLLEGIKLAFSCLDGSYFKVRKSDFYNSDDTKPIEIFIELDHNSIASFNYGDAEGSPLCGFKVKIRKTRSGRYIRDIFQYNGLVISRDIILDDSESLPNVHLLPLYRVEDLYAPGLSVGLSSLLESDEEYKKIREKSKKAIKGEIRKKEEKFTDLMSNFTDGLYMDVTAPLVSDEKLFIVNGDKEHGTSLGSGYRSIANMFLCILDDKVNILLIDEIENHVHPSLLRSLIRKLSDDLGSIFVVTTTHSPVVVNEIKIESLIEIDHGRLSNFSEDVTKKLDRFLHPGRGELIVSENIVLVEGYTEELILNDYIRKNRKNWTVINVAGVMFEPYIRLACFLEKSLIVISDDDRASTEEEDPTPRFKNLKKLCDELGVTLVQVDNTLETDLYNKGYLTDIGCDDFLKVKPNKTKKYMVAKDKTKISIALKLIERNNDLSGWHVIKAIEDEFGSN